MESPTEANAELRTRIRQQDVVAELGQQALETDDLDQLMHDASVAVADTLDNDYCKVLELFPGGDEVFLRQGVGWREGLVGTATVPADVDSQAGYTLLSEEPIIVDDLRTDERFSGPELPISHDVISGVSVVIGSVDDPWGVLGTHTTEQQEFTEHDANFVQSVANVLASAIQNEQAQSELEEIYGRISDAFFALDEEWRFRHLNERAHELINPEGRTLVGKNIWEEFPKAIGRKFKSEYKHAMSEQETVSFEEYYPEPLDVWAEVRAYPSETGLSVYFQDITERKERERALEESEQRYRTLAESFPNGVVSLFDEDLRYTLAAGQAFEDLPLSPADIEDRTPREVVDDDVADILEPTLRAALDGEKESVELSYGGREWIVHAVPITDDRGDVFAGMRVAQDITERIEYERKLEETVTDLEESNERLESFARTLAHELRNPVTIGQIYGQQLTAETDAEAVDYVTEAFDRIEDMIDVLLVVARGREAVGEKSSVNLAAVAREAWDEADTPEATLEVAIDDTIQADETYIRHLFKNLFENAVEHGGADVTVTVGELSTGFYVADDGSGIPAEDRDAVFEGGYTTAAGHGGTGLGLAFVKELAEVYEWDCAVTESAAGGAQFKFQNVTQDA